MFIVLRGALRASLPRGGGHLEQLLIYGPGDFAGTLALIDGGATHAELEAREDTLALRQRLASLRLSRETVAVIFSVWNMASRDRSGSLDWKNSN